MRWTLIPLLALASFLPLLSATQDPPPVPPVTVFLVRHAETDGSTRGDGDPLLSKEGEVRAEALAQLLSQAGISQLYSSELARTQATLAPLAEAVGLQVQAIANADAKVQLERINQLAAGSVALVCGHSNTVPTLAQALGLPLSGLDKHPQYGPLIPHASYDRLYVLTLPRAKGAKPKLLELRYGQAAK
jgi:phosphohistidine phosphatase SixA